MSYTPPIKIFILDDSGKKISCKEAAFLLKEEFEDINDNQIRYYVTQREARTLQDVREIKEYLKKPGRLYNRKRKKYKTKYGYLTVREIHDRHPDKENIKITAISSRIAMRGGDAMAEELWEPLQKKTAGKKQKKRCNCCWKIRKRKFFKKEKKNKDGLSNRCITCGDIAIDLKEQEREKNIKRRILSVKPGQRVRARGLLFEVKECLPNKGRKADLCCYRVMEDNGQVLRRTIHRLYGNWQLEA